MLRYTASMNTDTIKKLAENDSSNRNNTGTGADIAAVYRAKRRLRSSGGAPPPMKSAVRPVSTGLRKVVLKSSDPDYSALAKLKAKNEFTETNTFNGEVNIYGNIDILGTGTYKKNGSLLASSNLSDYSNIAKLDANNEFTGSNEFIGNNKFIGNVDISGDIDISGTYKRNGKLLASSDLSDTSNIAKLDASNEFTGSNEFRGNNKFIGKVDISGDIDISGTVDITGDISLNGHMTVDTEHDIKILNHSEGIFSRVSTLEGNRHLLHILGSTSDYTSLVMSCKFWSLPMNSGYALNDYIMGQGHTTTPQTYKYNNHYQTVLAGGSVGVDLTDFTKTQSSVSSSAYSVNINIEPDDWSWSAAIQNVIISGTGYINWSHGSWHSSVSSKYNKMIRIGHYCNDAIRVTIDGQAIVWAKYGNSNGIVGTGNATFNSVCVVRGPISALEIMYIGGTGGNYCNLQFNVLGAWD